MALKTNSGMDFLRLEGKI